MTVDRLKDSTTNESPLSSSVTLIKYFLMIPLRSLTNGACQSKLKDVDVILYTDNIVGGEAGAIN